MKEKTKEKTERQPLSVIFGNALYALKTVHAGAPGFLAVSAVSVAAEGLRDALTNVLILRYAVNAVQNGVSFRDIALVVLMVMVIQATLSAVSNLLSPWAQPNVYSEKGRLRVQKYLDNLLFEKARALDLSSYENPTEYDRYFKARDGSLSHINSVFNSVLQFCYRGTSLTISAAVLIDISPSFALFVILPLISSVLFKRSNDIYFTAEMEQKKYMRSREYAKRSFYLIDFVKEMRMSGFSELMLRRFKKDVDSQAEIIHGSAPRIAAFNYVGLLLQEIILPLGAMAYAVWLALGTGSIMYGDCLVVINSITAVSWGCIALIESTTEVNKQSLFIQNIRDFLSAPVHIASPENPLPVKRGDLEFRSVSFTYDGAETPIIKNLSFTVHDGEKVAFVGQNGAGKSTVAKLMLRLYDVTDGEIFYGGVNIKDLDLAAYRDAFAVVFQDFRNFSITAAENVLLRRMNESDRETVESALKKADIYDKISLLDKGMDSRLTKEFEKDGVNLSGGEGQKLSIARIYAKTANIAILDEPTSALDPVAEYKMYENMMDACRDRSVVFISHRLSSAVLADRVILLSDGEIAETGTHKQLMEKDGEYAAMFRMQAENYRESEVTANAEV